MVCIFSRSSTTAFVNPLVLASDTSVDFTASFWTQQLDKATRHIMSRQQCCSRWVPLHRSHSRDKRPPPPPDQSLLSFYPLPEAAFANKLLMWAQLWCDLSGTIPPPPILTLWISILTAANRNNSAKTSVWLRRLNEVTDGKEVLCVYSFTCLYMYVFMLGHMCAHSYRGQMLIFTVCPQVPSTLFFMTQGLSLLWCWARRLACQTVCLLLPPQCLQMCDTTPGSLHGF